MLGTITLTVGQPDGVSVAQKEEDPDTMDTVQEEVAPQVNGEKVESPDVNEISAVEEKAAEEKPDDASEVGFKKIFRFVGLKFTLKRDKTEEKEPVKLLTVKDKEAEEVSKADEPTKEEEAATAEEKSTADEKEVDTATQAEVIKDGDKAETTEAPAEGAAPEATDEAVKEEGAEKEEESTPPPQETTMSPFRKLFSSGLFSNLRKKASIKKTKEEEDKDAAAEEEIAKKEETAGTAEEKEVKDEVEQETKEAAPETPVEDKTESKEAIESSATPEASATSEEVKPETAAEPEVSVETPATATDETKGEEKAEASAEEEKAPAEVTTEAELLSSQEKVKSQGSPLKKLFAGAGLKKLSTKKQKAKKETETKLTESGEQAAEQLQSSCESAEAPKAESGPSSPEESGEHAIAVEVTTNDSSQETDGEVTSDGEKKKEGIIAWSSFKKLVTPKKRVKRSSESEDEATGEKPAKSATLSSSESAALADKSVEEEAKEDKPTEEESKTENTEKLVSSTEEPKKKMDTSVSWEALMCMGGPKKRTRRTSDSDDEETKIEEELPAAGGEHDGVAEAAVVSSQNTEYEGEATSSPEPLGSPPERESAWDTLKRMVMSKNKAKAEDKLEDSTEQVQSDSEAPKDESSFSLKKFLPGRRKKKAGKQASSDLGSGEEDSDTPAVVPLSEYSEQEDEQEAPAEAAAEAPPEAAVESAAVQIKISAEDRSPSWIPAVVDVDDKHDELSDIPEEVENAVTPKSVDTDITEDDIEDEASLPPKGLGRLGRRLSTAEVMPVAPAPAAETTPVDQGPKPETASEVIEGIHNQITDLPLKTSVTIEAVPVDVASEKTEYEPPTEKAESTTNTILEPHTQDEAMPICTGLGTKEIAKIALEKPALPIIEAMAEIRDALSSERSLDWSPQPPSTEEAIIAEDEIVMAQVHEVETTDLEPQVEDSQTEVTDIQAASEGYEPEIEKVGIVSTVVEESEVLQPATVMANSPKAVVVNPITPTTEAPVCAPVTEVTEPTIETKEVKIETEQLAATEENTPVREVVQAICETTQVTMTKESEVATPVLVPDEEEEVPVITQTMVLFAPPGPDVVSEMETVTYVHEQEPVQGAVESVESVESVEATVGATVETPLEATVEPTVEATVEPTVETIIEAPMEPTVEATVEPTVETTLEATVEATMEAGEKMEEIKEDIDQTIIIEAQSMVITQAVIQEAMDKVSEDVPEPPKATTPTNSIPSPVQATSTTEKEIEISKEMVVITEAPAVVACEKPPRPLCVAMEVIDTIPVEVTESLTAEEDTTPEDGLKKAVEVKVSEETVEIKEVSQTGEEQSKEDSEVQEPDVKEAKEEVKPQSEGAKSEAPSEEDKKKVPEIHMPVQVVLQTAQVIEESVEEEAVVEFDSNGPVAKDTSIKAKSPASENKLSTVSEEPQASEEESTSSHVTEAAASQPETEKTTSIKCAEVMAQVIEVIEEAVKEIEPVSSEITAAS